MSDITLQMPCGFLVTRSLKDLGHYQSCNDSACQARWQVWEDLKKQSSGQIKSILDKNRG